MESIIEIYSPEWWHERWGTFTGSEIWKLLTEPRTKKAQEAGELSETAQTYIIEKVWEALAGQAKQGFDSWATEYGNENEPIAKANYTRRTGNIVTESRLVYNPGLLGFTGSPDGLVGEDGLIEIKCPANGGNHLKNCFITSDEVLKSEHKEYYWQMMAYMYLTGRKWCDFVSFDGRIDSDLGLFIYRLNRNEEDIELMVERVKQARVLFNQFYKTFKGEAKEV
jgi:hypothetical protein